MSVEWLKKKISAKTHSWETDRNMLENRAEINTPDTVQRHSQLPGETLGEQVLNESLFLWVEPMCSVETLKNPWAKALENSHTSQQFNRSWLHTDPVSTKESSTKGWHGEHGTDVGWRGFLLCPPAPILQHPPPPQVDANCLPILSLLTHHVSTGCLRRPHGCLPPRQLLSESSKKIMYGFPAPCSLVCFMCNNLKNMILWDFTSREKRAYCAKEGNWGLTGDSHHVP